jgi:hypothetical protein
MVNRLVGVWLGLLLVGAMIYPAHASSSAHRSGAPARTIVVTFRIDLTAQPERGTTFWVAYGPLDDHFGVVRLHQVGQRTFAAAVRLPTDGHTDFAYLAANGAIKTRLGWVPGDPSVTIRVFHRVTPGQGQLPPVSWTPAVG